MVLFDSHVFTNAIVLVVVFAPFVMAVDPMVTVRPMAGHPDHFPIAFPVARAMAVIWLVTDFDA